MKLILGAFLIDLSIGNLLFKKRNDQTFLSKNGHLLDSIVKERKDQKG